MRSDHPFFSKPGRKFNRIFLLVLLTFPVGFHTCIDPYTPVFDNLEYFVIIRGSVTDQPGETEVKISESSLLLGAYSTQGVSGATVSILDNEGIETPLFEIPGQVGVYRPDPGFHGLVGRSYRLQVTFSDGRRYHSEEESITEGVAIDSVYTEFDQEYEFNEQRGEFVPSHRILIDWQDPADEVNYYRWRYTLFRDNLVCLSCNGGVYRGEDCIRRESIPLSNRYDYLCAGACWNIEPVNTLTVFSDEFSNGNFIRAREVAHIVFESRKPFLIEIGQYSISSREYKFNKLFNDIALDGGGLNATLPGFIIGNITNPDEPEEKVIGFFGASARKNIRLYVARTATMGTPTGDGLVPNLEPPSPPENIPPAPCTDGPFRTSIKPEGWP